MSMAPLVLKDHSAFRYKSPQLHLKLRQLLEVDFKRPQFMRSFSLLLKGTIRVPIRHL